MSNLPTAVCNGITFFPVPKFTGAEAAFGAREEAFFSYNNRPEIPREFKQLASELFFNGGHLPKFADGVNRADAANALRAWLGSWAPKHECKEATVAYALWLWTNKEAMKKILSEK